MVYIKKLTSTNAILQNGYELPVGNKFHSECKKQFLLWKGVQ